MKAKTLLRTSIVAASLYAALPLIAIDSTSSGWVGFSAHAAEEGEKKKDTRKTKKSKMMSKRASGKIVPIYDIFGLENPTDADYQNGITLLNDMKLDKWSNYDKQVYWRLKGGLYANLEDYPNALKAVIEQLKFRAEMEPSDIANTVKMAGQLYASQENYTKAISFLNEWFGLEGVEPIVSDYNLRASLYYQTQDYKNALTDLKTVAKMETATQGFANERTYDMLFAVYNEFGDQNAMLETARIRAKHYTTGKNWRTLGAMYLQDENYVAALSAYQVCYDQGYLEKGSQITNFASVWASLDNPYMAAKVFNKGMKDGLIEKNEKNYSYLAQWYYGAREYGKAIDARTEAAKLGTGAKNWSELARAQVQEEQFDGAIRSAKKALKIGGLKDPAMVYVLMGQAYIAKKDFNKAIDAFDKGMKAKGASSKYAKGFLVQASNQKKLIDSIAEAEKGL